MKGPAAILIAVHSKKCCFVAVKKGERKEKSDCIFKNFKKLSWLYTAASDLSRKLFFFEIQMWKIGSQVAISKLLTLKFLLVMRKEASILAMIYLKYKSEKLIILINIPFNQINK